MRTIRWLSAALLSSVALVAAGCGGGGSGGGTSGGATLAGHLLSRDGSTSNLGGVSFTLMGTGQTVTTAPDGTFAFGDVPSGTIALKVTDPAASPARIALAEVDSGGGADDPAGHDAGDDHGDATNGDGSDDGDDHDTGDDDFDVPGVRDGESLEIHVSTDHGVVTSVEVARTEHDGRSCESRLAATDVTDDLDATGEFEVEADDSGDKIKVDVEHFTAGRDLSAFVVREGVDAGLGSQVVSDTGRAEWLVDTSLGDALPFGVASVNDLDGSLIEVRDTTTGTVLLRGTITSTPGSVDDHDGDGHSDEGDGDRLGGRANLPRVTATVGEAHVAIEHRAEDVTRDEFKVEVSGQVTGLVVEVWLADGSAVLTNVGSLTIGAEGEGEFHLDTHDGDTLPFGVTNLGDLTGRAIELRTGAGAVLYAGTVPELVIED